MFTELVYGPLIFSPLCGFPNLDNRVWPTFGHFSAVSQRPPVGCLVFAPHLHQLQQCLFQVPQGNQIKICRWDCGAPHSSNSCHLTEMFARLPLRKNMGNKKLMEKSWWLAAGHILTWHDTGIVDWEFSLENFTFGGLGGVGFRRPCYRICWGYGSAFSGEAGLGASLHSKSSDLGSGSLCPVTWLSGKWFYLSKLHCHNLPMVLIIVPAHQVFERIYTVIIYVNIKHRT